MTPSEEMIPRRLRFKIASHGRTADWANQLFKFGGWNRVAESCRELGRFEKDQKKRGHAVGTTTRQTRSSTTSAWKGMQQPRLSVLRTRNPLTGNKPSVLPSYDVFVMKANSPLSD